MKISDILPDSLITDLQAFLYELQQGKKKYLLQNDILLEFERCCNRDGKTSLLDKNSGMLKFLKQITALILQDHQVIIVHRYRIAKYRVYKLSASHSDYLETISVTEFLDFLDDYIAPQKDIVADKLRLDFLPFYDYSPSIRDPKEIGSGIAFLNKYMSSNLFQNPDKWNRHLFEFLKIHSLGGQQLLVSPEAFKDYTELVEHLQKITDYLGESDPDTSVDDVMPYLKQLGFEIGWGDSARRILETMQLLLNLFNSPDSENLEKFISRIPMISKIAIISPHGWFGQEDVLGKPDTGGQVVYILDQVRAVEKYLKDRLASYGLDITPKIVVVTRLIPDHQGTTSNQPLEKIHRTLDSWILRIPFTTHDGTLIREWISRFDIWPHLSRFAATTRTELLSIFEGRPDLIIGNYSDGNLVATLLSQDFDVVQCNISHALEKAKYLFSDLHWTRFEDDYHFSQQFIADLIAMNMSDFIITSTYQEIAGTETTMGQYESYQFFTMPGLVQVESGIDLFHPKFNVIPPGVDEEVFFPHTMTERRLPNQTDKISGLLFQDESKDILGHFDDLEKTTVMTMARLDRVKNITGLVESFGMSADLQDRCNLLVIAGKIDPELACDEEERAEIKHMHELINRFELAGKIRWLGIHLAKDDSGEAYRVIADRQGVFVQPALFEGFGLTVLEAMLSGLPVFATGFGGPSEIIQDGVNGFLINPSKHERISSPIIRFVEAAAENAGHWQELSENSVKRVQERFTWEFYSQKLLTLTALYGFWRYSVSKNAKRELQNYCHLLFHLLFEARNNTSR